MGLNDISALIFRLLRHLILRAAGWFLVGIFALGALYQATVSVSAALELQFGVVYAHLIIATVYALAAAITIAVLWYTPRRTSSGRTSVGTRAEPKTQIAAIVQAMLFGYSLSRRKQNR